MITIKSNEANRLRIEGSIERIKNNCSNETREKIESVNLIIADETTALEIYNDLNGIFAKTYAVGFGGIKGKITYQDNSAHLVVLNIANIDRFQLDQNEFDGVFSHELGHIFNENPVREVPSVMNGNNMTEIKDARNNLLKEMEFYADYFSKLVGSSSGLLSSMQKYIASENCLNRELFLERIEMLKGDAILLGTIKATQ